MQILRYFITCAAVSCASVAYADLFTFSTPAGAGLAVARAKFREA